MTCNLSEEGDAPMAPKRSRWYWLKVLLIPTDHRSQTPDAATEAAQIEAAFFASYMDKRPD